MANKKNLKNPAFKRVALVGRQHVSGIAETLITVKNFLESHHIEVVLEQQTAATLLSGHFTTIPSELLCKHCDLMIVVGGDGSLLHAARIAVKNNLPVLGINRGRLGFLTDISPDDLHKILDVLSGHYQEESRFLLTVTLHNKEILISESVALNEVALLPGNIAHMIEFDVYINQEFVCSQRADGMIVATPTGSTAYALSGGGPILHPQLDAVVLVPMFPHTLSSRPIVIKGDSEITLIISKSIETSPQVSCDGQGRIPLPPGSQIDIQKNPEKLRLIHPTDYNYFETLRVKLGWEG